MSELLDFNTIIIELKNLKINRWYLSYEDLTKMEYEDLRYKMLPETFEMFKKFSHYMVERTKDLDFDLYDPLVCNWAMNVENNMNESFDLGMYDEILNMLKKNVEKSIKNKEEEINERSKNFGE